MVKPAKPARIKRTLAEWQALQAERAKVRPPETQGAYGIGETIGVVIDGVPWQAPSVQDLLNQGLLVEVRYTRRWLKWAVRGHWYRVNSDGSHGKMSGADLGPKRKHHGGRTLVIIRDPSTRHYGEGHAYCTAQDSFDRRKGYVLAVNRALQDLQR